jgi:nucleoside-diphosphate-sugar epimerase
MGFDVSTLIVGCGYLGRRVGRQLAARGESVHGTVRGSRGAESLLADRIEPIIADVLDPASLGRLPSADRVLYCVGFDRASGVPMRSVYVDGVRNVLGALHGKFSRLVYVSTTSVYGQTDGGWVDEDSSTDPISESGRVCLEAEKSARSLCGDLVVIRYTGLYGPGRIIGRGALVRGEAIEGDAARYLNLIHIDDAVAAAIAALDRGRPGRTYLASDDRPVTRHEYYTLAAIALGAPPARFVPREAAIAGSRCDEPNKRVSNIRLKTELGVALTYPDVSSGLAAAFAAEPT